jgi:uncharacterized protein
LISYLDTSAIVAALTEEVLTVRVRNWLESQLAGSLFISEWVLAEVASALSIKVRTGILPLEERNEVLIIWRSMIENQFVVLPLTTEDFRSATLMAERHDLSLRASDALHIAAARSAGCDLVTFDKQMASAALQLGIPVVNV